MAKKTDAPIEIAVGPEENRGISPAASWAIGGLIIAILASLLLFWTLSGDMKKKNDLLQGEVDRLEYEVVRATEELETTSARLEKAERDLVNSRSRIIRVEREVREVREVIKQDDKPAQPKKNARKKSTRKRKPRKRR